MEKDEIVDETDEDSSEVEIIEFFVDDEDIEELVAKLNELKQSKGHFHYEIDEDTEFLVHHADSLEEDEDNEEWVEGEE